MLESVVKVAIRKEMDAGTNFYQACAKVEARLKTLIGDLRPGDVK